MTVCWGEGNRRGMLQCLYSTLVVFSLKVHVCEDLEEPLAVTFVMNIDM